MKRALLVALGVCAALFLTSCGGKGNPSSPGYTPSSEDNLFGSPTKNSASGSSMKDSRDGHTYKVVTIGTQTWMAENLNYNVNGSFCYDGESYNCSAYGRLYTWTTSVGKTEEECGYRHLCGLSGDVRGICPAGWHLPSKREWLVLIDYVGGKSVMGPMLKSTSGWEKNGNGKDQYGFNALPAGYLTDKNEYHCLGRVATFWSSTEGDSETVYSMNLTNDDSDDSDAGFYAQYKLGDYGSVRCIQD